MIIPIKIREPGNLIAYKITVITIPNIAKSTGGSVQCSMFLVQPFLTMIPELCKPTNVMNNPIPAETAIFIDKELH